MISFIRCTWIIFAIYVPTEPASSKLESVIAVIQEIRALILGFGLSLKNKAEQKYLVGCIDSNEGFVLTCTSIAKISKICA